MKEKKLRKKGPFVYLFILLVSIKNSLCLSRTRETHQEIIIIIMVCDIVAFVPCHYDNIYVQGGKWGKETVLFYSFSFLLVFFLLT